MMTFESAEHEEEEINSLHRNASRRMHMHTGRPFKPARHSPEQPPLEWTRGLVI